MGFDEIMQGHAGHCGRVISKLGASAGENLLIVLDEQCVRKRRSINTGGT